jgi:hypothetical protein
MNPTPLTTLDAEHGVALDTPITSNATSHGDR